MAIVKKARSNPVLRWLSAKPARIISASFLLVILIGAALLTLPAAAASGESFGFLRALFTATSATCVTGLVVTDTATGWSTFGELVIIGLIQIGGLGIVTITSFFFSLLRRKTSLRAMILTAESTSSFGFTGIFKLVRKIVAITLSIELIGGALLAWRYYNLFGRVGIYKGFWQGVSAFCNAGFDLIGDTRFGPFSSLINFNGDPVIILTSGLLLVFGGLGFVVWSDILAWPWKRKLDFHSQVVLLVTAILIFLGTIAFYFFEHDNTSATYAMGNLPAGQQWLASWFQSVTPRTAGFNSIDQASLTESSKLLTTILMFIGAAPGSTGGGIKITTFTVILATIASDLKGDSDTLMFRHRVARETFTRALAIFGLGLTILLSGTLLMTYFEREALSQGAFTAMDLLFEQASAFGTVGLSAAGTPQLTKASWLVLIPSMYLGRVGPAAFAIGLAMRKAKGTERVHPEGKILVG
jgi:trk system potassium uptake protein TrkH